MGTSLQPSLPEVHGSVSVQQATGWKRWLAFAGPAYLISVGYMDPGNWATDLDGGARFGYTLLWVLVMSNAMAILLQTLSARLGIVAGRDLAQACREAYPQAVSYALWVLCEIAIAACDLAEVLGAAIALNLLFHLPLLIGVLLTSLDTLVLLLLTGFGIRAAERLVLGLVLIIALCLMVEIWWAKPLYSEVFAGLVPRLSDKSLYAAIAILGATVMPHNLYLHSALVQTRQIGSSAAEKRSACRYNFLDSVVALNGALLVNAAILVLAGASFFRQHIEVTEIQQAHLLLSPLLGSQMAGVLFAVALLCAGQSSTLTGTMAGQIVMEGFLDFRMQPWLRRLITRSVAILPAALTIWWVGDKASYQLLILSQVVLSLQLPFAVIPLIQFTGSRQRMGEFASSLWVRALAWITAVIILGLNMRLLWTTWQEWQTAAGSYQWLVTVGGLTLAASLGFLLAYITLAPLWARGGRRQATHILPPHAQMQWAVPLYRRLLVTVDHSALDRVAVSHAAALGRQHAAEVLVLHVEEGVTSQVYGSLAHTAEVTAGAAYLNEIVAALTAQGLQATSLVCHGPRPEAEIVRVAREQKADLVVMGAHGHSGLKDLIFGTTINGVRHALQVPVLIVRE